MLVFGLSLFIFTWSFGDGFHDEMIRNAVATHMAHIQIHKKGFTDNPVLKKYIKDPAPVISDVESDPDVASYAPRVKCQGLASSAYSSSNVSIIGIDPALERRLTIIQEKLVEGNYIPPGGGDGAMIGADLSRKLEIEVGDKVIVTGQSLGGELKAEAFEVVGIYRTSDPTLDKYSIYVPIVSAQKFFGMGEAVNEIAIDVKSEGMIDSTVASLKKTISDPGLEILSWRQVNPALVQFIQLDDISLYIMIFIIAVMIGLEVYNTLLMSILERTREFGVMLAIGTKPRGIVAIVIMEALFMAVIMTVLGCAAGGLTSLYFVYHPIDFSIFSSGMEMFAVSNLIHFSLGWKHFIVSSLIMFFLVVFAALYPAFLASRLKPVDAIRFF